MRTTMLITLGILLLIFTTSGGASNLPATDNVRTTTVDPPVMMAQNPSWICCVYTCTTNGGQTHDTDFCHPSSIGPHCPDTPAPSENAEDCELVDEYPANSCQECVNGLQ
jgi:hypothetical protein